MRSALKATTRPGSVKEKWHGNHEIILTTEVWFRRGLLASDAPKKKNRSLFGGNGITLRSRAYSFVQRISHKR